MEDLPTIEKIEVLNLQGTKVHELFLWQQTDLMDIALDFLPSGVYLLKLFSSQGYIIHKIVKLRE